MFGKLLYLWKQRKFWKLTDKSPEEIFTEVYKENMWGGEKGEFYSGTGTTNPNTEIYISNVIKFLDEHPVKTIVDLGCGDFRIMQRVLAQRNVHYIGLDVVKDLVDYNNKKFGNERIRFQHANIVEDPLPSGDVVLIRQVLQHLSNEEIQKILKKITAFQWAVITEHLPAGDSVVYNVDKIHGPHIRMKANSGVFIDKPPFSVPNTKVLFEYREDDPVKGKLVPAVVRTYLVSGS